MKCGADVGEEMIEMQWWKSVVGPLIVELVVAYAGSQVEILGFILMLILVIGMIGLAVLRKEARKRKEFFGRRINRIMDEDDSEQEEGEEREKFKELKKLNKKVQDCDEKIKMLTNGLILTGMGFVFVTVGSWNGTKDVMSKVHFLLWGEITVETENITEQTETAEPETESRETETGEDGTKMTETVPDRVYHSTECRMNLEGMTKPRKVSDEVRDRVLMGLSGLDVSRMLDRDIYPYVERSLTGTIGLSKESELRGEPEEGEDEERFYKLQAEVLSVTQENDAFHERLDVIAEKPPAFKGSDRWYKLLPSWENLQNIIDSQEYYMELCPDGDLAGLLYNNYIKLAGECELQGMAEEHIVYYYCMAAFSLLRRLEFFDYNLDNSYEMLIKLRNIYNKLAAYGDLDDESGDGVRFGAISRMMEQYIRYWYGE